MLNRESKNKMMKVDFLGNKSTCLSRSRNTISQRIVDVNQLFELYANNDRRFFCNTKTGNIAKFAIVNDKLVFYDRYTGEAIFNTDNTNKNKWKGEFNDGGSNQDIVMCLANYIKTGIPFFYWWLRIFDSGYKEETIKQILEFGFTKNIFTKEKRFRFWLHNQKKISRIEEYIKEENIDFNKCIIVHVKSGDTFPNWVEEFNFLHAISIT